jgi:hypothetical protein
MNAPLEFPRVNVEEALATCVEAVGGQVLDRVLGSARPFKNADYYFPHEQVVAELKVLTEDILHKEDFRRATSDLYARWMREGKVERGPPGRRVLRSQDLPAECAREWLGLLGSRLKRSTIKKANKQIRDTKEHLQVPDAVGLLIIANDGNFAFKPDVLFHLLAHSLKGCYRSIDALIFFTANEPLRLPGFEQEGANLWTNLVVEGRRPLPVGFSGRLGSEWYRLYSELISGLVYEVRPDHPTAEEWDDIDFVNKRLRRTH